MPVHAKILLKLEQSLRHYQKLRFRLVAEVPMELAETREHFRTVPAEAKLKWRPIRKGTAWGGDGITGWFRGDVEVPKDAPGKLFLLYRQAFEALLIFDGDYKGVFNDRHPAVLALPKSRGGKRHHVAIESYSGHSFPGTMPHDEPIVVKAKEAHVFDGVYLAEELEDVSAFCYDLEVLLKLHKSLDANSFRKGTVTRELQRVWSVVTALPAETAEDVWRPGLSAARKIMAPLLAKKNGDTTPAIALVAHSHIDTAWLWTIAETRRKCARTFSSMANLMEQYPEVIFLQSAPCHADMVRQDYPEIFAKIKRLVKQGRWEPNGGAWIEPDCNLTGGEALVRQFLVGIQWTREHFGYSSDTLWQPDVFGYSAALPQILQGCGIRFFCTTKMAWNDTNRFPYDTFTWRGIDGSEVLTHLNSLPQSIETDEIVSLWNWAQHKDSEEVRLASWGWGDGGGGPAAEDMEKVRRLADLEGAPRTYYTRVSDFMQGLESTREDWPTWVGELYLELHRGTLTAIAPIKRGNRKTEIALREAEFTHVVSGTKYPKAELDELWKDLLINQFHDILPGTSIQEANDVAFADFARLVPAANALARRALPASPMKAETLVVANSLSWNRTSAITVDFLPEGHAPRNAFTQDVVDLEGNRKTVIGGLSLPPLSVSIFPLEKKRSAEAPSPFRYDGTSLRTPHGVIRFDKTGAIRSYVLTSGREVVGEHAALNTFLIGEDVPYLWDQWDIDGDQELRMAPGSRLVSREVVADGAIQMRLRSEYKIGRASTLRQDMIVHADRPEITFETLVDWREKHQLLKVAFSLAVHSEMARHEIQYGHVERPTHRNLPQDRARFEVCCHKWMDLSDNGFGVAILNDCKYGVGVLDNEIRLSLLKSGTHPDPRGDNGVHAFTYAVLPHEGGFSVPAVARPAYELNIPVTTSFADGKAEQQVSLLTVDTSNIIVESVKQAEDGKGFIVRLYEAGRCSGPVRVTFNESVSKVRETNMLEEDGAPLPLKKNSVLLSFRAFEIKTLRCR